MIQGLGIDIVEISRIQKALTRFPRFKEKVFSAQENAYCISKKKPEKHFAARFAAKEAASKALGTGKKGFSWKDIEVARENGGKPSILLSGNAALLAGQRNIQKMHVSISFSDSQATAVVIAES